MKNAILLFLAALVCSLVIACGDDGDDNTKDGGDHSTDVTDGGDAA